MNSACWCLAGVVGALVAGLTACETSLSARGPLLTDSAGVAIVDHGALDYGVLPVWTVSDTPEVRIGVVQGDPAYEWDQLFAADRLSDGTLVALSRRNQEVRAFDPSGNHLWTTGREGEGPGEFLYPWSLHALENDAIVISDPGTGRITVLGPGGRLVSTARVDAADGTPVGWGPAGDAEVLIEIRSFDRTDIDGHAALVTRSDFRTVNLDGEVVRDLGKLALDIGYQEGKHENGAFSGAIFDEIAVFAPGPRGVWHSDADAYEIGLYGDDGIAERIVRWDGPDRTITSADLDRVREVWTEGSQEDPEMVRYFAQYFAHQPVSDQMATFARLLTDEQGRIWIQDYVRPHLPDVPSAWLILSSDGMQALGRLSHPSTFKPYSIGDGWMLGATHDALDVEYLELYRFEG